MLPRAGSTRAPPERAGQKINMAMRITHDLEGGDTTRVRDMVLRVATTKDGGVHQPTQRRGAAGGQEVYQVLHPSGPRKVHGHGRGAAATLVRALRQHPGGAGGGYHVDGDTSPSTLGSFRFRFTTYNLNLNLKPKDGSGPGSGSGSGSGSSYGHWQQRGHLASPRGARTLSPRVSPPRPTVKS